MANEFVGLPAAFMSIGPNGAVSSLWPASDGPTLFLMARLMRELHSGTPPARALKDAQVWLSNSTGTQLAEVLRSLRLPQEAMRRSRSRSLESATAVAGPLQSFGRGGIRVYWVQMSSVSKPNEQDDGLDASVDQAIAVCGSDMH
jgi:CHAT domain-containing protein